MKTNLQELKFTISKVALTFLLGAILAISTMFPTSCNPIVPQPDPPIAPEEFRIHPNPPPNTSNVLSRPSTLSAPIRINSPVEPRTALYVHLDPFTHPEWVHPSPRTRQDHPADLPISLNDRLSSLIGTLSMTTPDHLTSDRPANMAGVSKPSALAFNEIPPAEKNSPLTEKDFSESRKEFPIDKVNELPDCAVIFYLADFECLPCDVSRIRIRKLFFSNLRNVKRRRVYFSVTTNDHPDTLQVFGEDTAHILDSTIDPNERNTKVKTLSYVYHGPRIEPYCYPTIVVYHRTSVNGSPHYRMIERFNGMGEVDGEDAYVRIERILKERCPEN